MFIDFASHDGIGTANIRNGSNVTEMLLQSGHFTSERYWPPIKSFILDWFLLR